MRLILPLTYRCNLNCEYCYVDKRGNESLPLLVGAKAVNFLMQNNKDKEVDLIFTGGEPLLEWEKMKKLIYCAEYAAKRSGALIRTLGFPTNGLLLNENILSFCRQKNIKLAVSFDGGENKRRTPKGLNSFFIVRKKFPLLLKYKDIVRIRLTVWPSYAKDLLLNFKKLLKIGFIRFDIQPVIGTKWSEKNRIAYLNNLIQSFEIIKRNKTAIDLKHLEDFLNRGEKKCPKASNEFLVDIDGSIYPCEFFLSIPTEERKKYIIGYVSKGVNSELIENYKNLRICHNNKNFPVIKDKCESCSVSQVCFKICLGFNIKERKFDLEIAQENWELMRGIERVFNEFANLI